MTAQEFVDCPPWIKEMLVDDVDISQISVVTNEESGEKRYAMPMQLTKSGQKILNARQS